QREETEDPDAVHQREAERLRPGEPSWSFHEMQRPEDRIHRQGEDERRCDDDEVVRLTELLQRRAVDAGEGQAAQREQQAVRRDADGEHAQRAPQGQLNAGMPVMARPRMRAWMSCVPSYVFTTSRFTTWRMTPNSS